MRHVVRLLNGNVGSRLVELVISFCSLRGPDTVRIFKVEWHADAGMVWEGGVRELDRSGNNAADVGGLSFRLLMLAVTLLESVVGCIRLSWYCNAFLSLSPGLWLIMWVERVLHLIRWSGLLVLCPKGVGWCRAGSCFLPGLAGIWDGEWIALDAAPITAHDVLSGFGLSGLLS